MDIFKTIVGKGPKKPGKEPNKKACLVIIAGKGIGKTFFIKEKTTIIGRSAEADFQIDDDMVSRKHCEIIIQDNEKVKIIDKGSTNGTLVNFEKIQETELKDGDKIYLGEIVIKFVYKDALEADFHDEIYKLASLDGLTKLYNKNHFKDLLEMEMSKAKRQNTPLALGMIDLDFFKQINDTHGHQAGDFVLVTIVNNIKQFLRKEDILARYGGEEFCLLLCNTNLSQAATVAEKIRENIENSPVIYADKKIPITISIGIKMFDDEITDCDTFIEKADHKLYSAKENGRNRITS